MESGIAKKHRALNIRTSLSRNSNSLIIESWVSKRHNHPDLFNAYPTLLHHINSPGLLWPLTFIEFTLQQNLPLPPCMLYPPTIRHMRIAVVNYKEVGLAILQNLLRFVGNSAF